MNLYRINQRVLITGASGFIGRSVAHRLSYSQLSVRAALRRPFEALPSNIERCTIAGLAPNQDWSSCLKDVDVVIHCAARVHVMNESEADPLAAFRKVNVGGTCRLAEQAAREGVKRFIFLSSIKVNGEATQAGHPFTAEDMAKPADPYGISKLEAEEGLRQLSHKTGMEHVIIRPVLVYGPGVKANFAQLVRIVAKGIPLPLASVKTKRSFVALDNLVDLIATCVDHPAAANQTFLASDNNDFSSAELIQEVARCLNKSPRLLPFPPNLLKLAAKAFGKGAIADRLLGSLQVDISHTCDTLGWSPPVSTRAALQKTVDSISRR